MIRHPLVGHNGVIILGLDAENVTKPPMVVRVPLSHMLRILSLPIGFDTFRRSTIVLAQAISESCKISQCAIYGPESCGSRWKGVRLLSLNLERDSNIVLLLAGWRRLVSDIAIGAVGGNFSNITG